MNHGMTEGLRKSLADLRENEERCRDAALAIQRVLEAEGALYPAAVIQFESGAIATLLEPKSNTVKGKPAVERSHAQAHAKAHARAAVSKPGPRTWPKTCLICGKDYAALSASSKCCSPACVEEKNRRYANAKYQAKAGKPAPKASAPKADKTPTGYQKVCVVCGKPFTPSRKDQKCCSTYCGKRRYLAVKPAGKPAPINLDKPSPAGQPTRIERIRMLAGADPIPQRVRDAAAEARDSENMG
jgi:hypothetical protein